MTELLACCVSKHLFIPVSAERCAHCGGLNGFAVVIRFAAWQRYEGRGSLATCGTYSNSRRVFSEQLVHKNVEFTLPCLAFLLLPLSSPLFTPLPPSSLLQLISFFLFSICPFLPPVLTSPLSHLHIKCLWFLPTATRLINKGCSEMLSWD